MKLPFAITRASGMSLTDQVVAGFTTAIREGVYGVGVTIPSHRDVARALGVSEIVTRTAYRKLARQKLVLLQRGVGSVVRDSGQSAWKGRVLFIVEGHNDNFYLNTVGDVLRSRLYRDEYLFSQVNVFGPPGKEGYVELDLALGHQAELIVSIAQNVRVRTRLNSVECPVVNVWNFAPYRRKNVINVHFDHLRGARAFVAECAARKIRNVWVLDDGTPFANPVPLLREAGIPFCEMSLGHGLERGKAADLQREAIDIIGREWPSVRSRRPDVIYFNDDFIANAALQTFARLGVSVPEDVAVVTLSNKGFLPVFDKSLTRVELDAVRSGEYLADCVASVLSGTKADAPFEYGIEYVKGDTF